MLLVSEVSPVDGALHQQNLLLLSYLAASPDEATLRFYLRNIMEPLDSLVFIAPTGTSTKTFIVMNFSTNQLTIVVGGMDNTFAQAANCLLSWGDTSTSNPFNTFEAAASNIVANVRPTPKGTFDNVRIIGHSYGGAVGAHLQRLLFAFLSQTGAKQLYTYGAPKPANQVVSAATVLFDVRRCFQNNDPVPSLPLTPEEVSSLWVYVGVPTARAWARWTQGVTGLVFDGFGHLVQSSNPTFPASPTVFYLSLLSWVTGIDAFANVGHSLSSYVAAAAILPTVVVFSPQPVTQRVRRQPDETVAVVTRQRNEELAIVATNTSSNPADAAVGIQSGIVLVPGVRYRGIVVGGVNWVYYGDTPVIPTRTRRTRRALVRYLNRSL
jgi:hypothetical protein